MAPKYQYNDVTVVDQRLITKCRSASQGLEGFEEVGVELGTAGRDVFGPVLQDLAVLDDATCDCGRHFARSEPDFTPCICYDNCCY